ncbi:MAG TPA: acyl-CoA dehydrogenase [Flavobacteriia bacterium]|nr:acyl-CoA dehydrogenase [Flavobacteriia bacterium]
MSSKIKGGEFIVKESKSEDIFTQEDLSEEQQMMRDSVKEFVDRELWPKKPEFEKKNYKLTEEVMRKAGEMGFLSISVPEAYGGMEMGFVSTVLVCDYISGATGSFATAYGAHTGIGTLPIVLYGTEEQKQKYVPALASGEKFGAYCLTEPDAGSDANSGKTTAELTEDGKHYKINGQKMWISNAGFAEIFTVFARIGDDKNISCFIVEYDPENPNGITLGEEEHKLGIRSSSTRQVFFSDTLVPVENMLSERGKGFKIAMNSLNVGRIKLSAACIDAGRRITTEAIKYANERKQFKTPIAQFGAIKKKFAEMATKIYATEAATYRAANDIQNKIDELRAEGKSHQEAELKGVEEFAIECAILKVYGSEMSQFVSDEGIQIYGGMGFSEEAPMESSWRDARITRIYEGTNEINRLLSVSMLIKRAMKGNIDLMSPAMAVGNSLMEIPSFETPDYSVLFSEEKVVLENLKKAFLMVSGKAIQTFMMELEKHQQLILDAAEILIEIYIAESTILRTEKLVNKIGEDKAEAQIAMAKLKLAEAVNKTQDYGKEAINYFAEGDENRMMKMGLKRFTKYTNEPNTNALRVVIADKIIADNAYKF